MQVGDRVQLREDVLMRHAKRIPPHCGFTTEQFAWRDTLGNLHGKIGVILRIFPGSKHVNVDFSGVGTIGIDNTELEIV